MSTIPVRALWLATLTNVIGGTTYYATKLALPHLPALQLGFVRSVVGVAVLLPFVGIGPLLAMARGGRRTWMQMLLLGIVGYSMPIVLGNFALRFTTATNASLLICTEPIVISVLGVLVLGERLSHPRVWALALGVAGATMIAGNGIPFLTMEVTPHLTGDLMIVGHSALWAVYSIAAKPLLDRHPPMAVSVMPILFSIPLLGPLAAWEFHTSPPSPEVWIGLAWAAGLGLFATAIASILWNQALRMMDASHMAGFLFLQPVAGVLLGSLALHEPLSTYAVAGGLLVLAGVVFLIRSGAPREAPVAA